MPLSETAAAAVHRKLRALAAVLRDSAATEHEKANAEALKRRIEAQLKRAGAPEGDWSDAVFRLGRAIKAVKQSTAPPVQNGDWTDNAFRIGRALRQGLNKWRQT